MAIILDGKSVSEKILDNLKFQVDSLEKKPTLAVILVGNNPASEVYVSVKERTCNKIGINSLVLKLDETSAEDDILFEIDKLNSNDNVNGIIVQLPLPKQIDTKKVIEKISVKKDVDCFNVSNVGKIASGLVPYCYPCTPKGIIKLCREYNIDFEGKHVVIIGRSNIVGKPLANMLINLNATVTLCHSKTKNLKDITKSADILVSAIGHPKFVTCDMVKENAIIIDVGISRVNGKLIGDVDFDNVFDKVSYITPVPKGIGPMTIASLMENTLELYNLQNKKEN